MLSPSEDKYNELIELLAEQEHAQWMSWSKHIVLDNGVSEETICRWRPKWIPYAELSEEEKEKDRIWARKVLEIIGISKP